MIVFSGWTVVFTLIYAQSPLYTSNQNQYFLHGLANANYGFLQNDWLANTLDLTPVFSQLVNLTYRIFYTDVLFYVYYAILLGLYLYSISRIGFRLYKFNQPRVQFIYLAILLVIHSAGMRFFLSRAIGPETTYLLEGGLAGQRLLGVVFQPSAFGVLLLFSILLFYKQYTFLSVLPIAMAVSFHPTYLLPAGMITLAFMVESYRETRNFVKSGSIGALALLLILPTLSYVFFAFGSTPPETTSQARDILVYFRIPHHALFSEWFDVTAVFQIVYILVAIYLVRGTRLFVLMALPLLFSALLTTLQVITQDEGLALLFPWRISTILVPLSVAILLGRLVKMAFERSSILTQSSRQSLNLACMVVVLFVMMVGLIRTVLEVKMIRSNGEREMMSQVKKEKKPQDVYLVPTKMQDFRLVTGAPIYIDFKSIPYQDVEVLEWYRRIQLATRFYENESVDCNMADEFAAEGVTHFVLDTDVITNPCESMRLEYSDDKYQVYSLIR